MTRIGGKMKYRIAIVVVLLCSAIGFARSAKSDAEHAPTAFEQTLMNAEKSFLAAAKKGDVGFFKSTLTDDFSFVAFDGELYGRQDMLDQFAGGGFDVLPYEMKVVPAADDVAIVTYNVVLRVPAVEDQGPPPRYQHFSTVWVKKGDSWKMKFLQMTTAHWGDW
ncbi:MAG TPA: nuclear transport factor 2 family protein [Candidatus Eisenbacteria bacterium]|nr:nuclear transport factor 2 family protein [Candidatus Eisenbacteria bacterium]